MRILQVFNRYLEVGGEEMSVERVASTLREEHLVFHCFFDSDVLTKRGSHPLTLARQAFEMLYNRGSVRRFKRQLAACRPDVILMHNVFPVGSIGIYQAALNSGVPVLRYIHNFRPFSVNGYLWANDRMIVAGLDKNFWPEIWAGSWQGSRLRTAWYAGIIWLMHGLGVYRRIAGWVAISQFMKDTFVAAGIPAEKVFLLPHSWDLAPLAEPAVPDDPAAPRPVDDPEPVILFLGRLTEAKGLRALVEAWAQVTAERSDGRLVIGGGGPLAEWLIASQSAVPRLEYLGFVEGDQKHDLLNNCRAMVVPSVWWEPLGLVVYEAYEHGRPVIAARSGGLTETVQNGQTGWLYEPNDVTALKNCILAAMNDRTEANRRGRAGRQWVENHTRSDLWRTEFEHIMTTVRSAHRAANTFYVAAPELNLGIPPVTAGRRPPYHPSKQTVSDAAKVSFSIVTPSFQQVEMLGRCAASVADQAGNIQVEHLIHDGMSGAEFDAWAASQGFADCRSERDGGMYDAINRGFLRATGEIVAWLNCDEQYLPGTLAKVATYFAQHPEVDILFGDIVLILPNGRPIGYRQAVVPMPGHIRSCFLSTFSSATFVRRKIIDAGYLLDSKFRAIADAVWIDQLLRAGYQCQVLNEALAVFTQTGSNLGQTPISWEEGNRWRTTTHSHGKLRAHFWSTLHRSRKFIHGAYRARNVTISIYQASAPHRRPMTARVSERWRGVSSSAATTAGAAPPASKIAICAYLADQNPGSDRSFGISRMSQVVLESLQAGGEVAVTTLASRTSQQAPANVLEARVLPWGTRVKWVRLLTDHLHPMLGSGRPRPDIFYFPKGYLPMLDQWCRPSVVTIHDTIIQHYDDHYPRWRTSWEYIYWAMMLKHTLRKADHILTVSESSKQQILAFMTRHRIARKPITVTYEPCLYETIPQPVEPSKENYVIHLASGEPHKRTADLIRWWDQATAQGRELPVLQLIGTVPPEVLPVLERSRTIVKRPFLDDAALQSAYRGARALILPSEVEGFGLPALEAYFLGTPVCYVRGTSVEEILSVATDQGGFSLDSPASLFTALDEVLAMSPPAIHTCGLALRHAYAADQVAAKIVAVMRDGE